MTEEGTKGKLYFLTEIDKGRLAFPKFLKLKSTQDSCLPDVDSNLKNT